MYIFRRGNRWWFRKATPIELMAVMGPEVRFSLGTGNRAEARRRAWVVQVALEQVYEVLRSERPLEPVRNVLSAVVEHARTTAAGIVLPSPVLPALERAVAAIGTASTASASTDEAMIPVEQVEYWLGREQPRAEVNRTAVELLSLASQISREKRRPPSERLTTLVSLAERLAAAGDQVMLDGTASLDAVRTIIRQEIERTQPVVGAIDPKAWLADVFARIADMPQNRLHELLPWNWTPPASRSSAQAA